MGGSSWSYTDYQKVTKTRIDSGTTFGYDTSVRRSGKYAAHDDLDPKKVAGSKSPYAGQVMRESRDSDDHPESLPIIIGFDSTGSMGVIPHSMQQKLGTVFQLLLDKQYATDPQIMISTYGDAYVDRVPLQVSQFESDNRIDENLNNLFLEGGGGGNNGETANLLMYFAAHHTVTDHWEKRGKKGYFFLIADEKTLPLTQRMVQDNIGIQEAQSVETQDIADALKAKWEVVVLVIKNPSSISQRSVEHYTELFGSEAVLLVESTDTIPETIAGVVGALEGNVTTDSFSKDLVAAGTSAVAVRQVSTTVSRFANKRGVAVNTAFAGSGTGAQRL